MTHFAAQTIIGPSRNPKGSGLGAMWNAAYEDLTSLRILTVVVVSHPGVQLQQWGSSHSG